MLDIFIHKKIIPLTKHINLLLRSLPNGPGVYMYYDNKNTLLYIGKAKNLKKRVASYFKNNTQNKKITLLVGKIYDIKYLLVETESDALLLENNLIKKQRPKYNVLLKDDKTYPWICISKEKVPRIFQARNIKNINGDFYGPYVSVQIVKLLLNIFSNFFYNSGWTPFSYLKRSITSEKELKKYLSIVEKIKHILKGNMKSLIDELTKEMFLHSKKLEFEKAQKLKEQILLLKKYQAKSTIVSSKIHNIDVITIVSYNNVSFVNYLRVYEGAVIQSYNLEIKKRLNESEEDLLEIALIDLRKKLNSSSKTVYCSIPINPNWSKLKIIVPKIGEKKQLLELSLKNAKYQRLEYRKKLQAKEKAKNFSGVLAQLKKDLNLKTIPKHIECFDNSNIQGSSSVASCVVFKNGKPKKSDYRIFNIKTVAGPNDFASMEEVVYRRYSRAINEGKKLPDLVVVDGGRGQVTSAKKSLIKLNINNTIALVGIAKKLEEIYLSEEKTPLFLDKRSQSLRLIQRLRDEAHRFGLKHHKQKRIKYNLHCSLEEVSGIGPKTINLLLQKFGSVKNILSVEQRELEKVIGKKKTKLILTSFS